jgi:hypothetical protein
VSGWTASAVSKKTDAERIYQKIKIFGKIAVNLMVPVAVELILIWRNNSKAYFEVKISVQF